MEKKKLLLVAVSAGIFLTLVLGASIVIFSPAGKTAAPEQTALISPGRPEIAPPPAPPVVLTEVAAALPEAAPAQSETQTPVVPKVSIITEAEIPAAKPDPVKVENTPPAPQAPQQPKPAAAVTQSKPAGSYWVQIGSYTQKNGADKVKQNLAERGLVSVITNSEQQGKTYYRVRIGPYVSQAEADYWLKLVRAIDGFEKSQVWKAGA